MTIIDGKQTSLDIRDEIKKEIDDLREGTGRVPGLAVVQVGENPASRVYVNSKVRTCEAVGMHSEKYLLAEDVSQDELVELIEKLNRDENINGILVQLPLPKHIDEEIITETISSEKDVDGFKAENLGRILMGKEDCFKSCTPYGIIELLKRYNVELSGSDAVVIGRSNIVGKPLAALLINESATVTVCHSRTKNLEEKVKQADIVIAAVGIKGFVTAEMVKDGAVVIDVGINRGEDGKLYGDVEFDEVSKKAKAITPVPGGVGPMTIAMLMKNTLKSFKKYQNLDKKI